MVAGNRGVKYVTTVKMLKNGLLRLPKRFRDELGLRNGAPFAFLRLGDALILLPVAQKFELLSQRVRAALEAAGATTEKLLATLPEARKEVYARRCGNRLSAGSAHSGLPRRRRK
jgi:bifunctional DNA-binding transcriptional regulator/antitoxin component of YhaV-PrlF toxin-antitoxin module